MYKPCPTFQWSPKPASFEYLWPCHSKHHLADLSVGLAHGKNGWQVPGGLNRNLNYIDFTPKNLSGSPYHGHYTIRSEIQKYPVLWNTPMASMQEVTTEAYDCRSCSYICP